jgi:hypothetical protein
MKAQVATTVSPESGMLLKTIRGARGGGQPGATLAATRTNNPLMLRTRLNNREEQGRGHGLF